MAGCGGGEGRLPGWSSGYDFAIQCRGDGWIPGRGAKISHLHGPKPPKNIKQKQYCNKFKTLKMIHFKKSFYGHLREISVQIYNALFFSFLISHYENFPTTRNFTNHFG